MPAANHDIHHPCEITLEDIESSQSLTASPISCRRAHHVVSEDVRVRSFVTASKQGDLEASGKMMLAALRSLRGDFDVSRDDLGLPVDTAVSIDGVAGSRMTGAGFGGCTVSLVKSGAIEHLARKIGEIYARETSHEARVFRFRAAGGVKCLT